MFKIKYEKKTADSKLKLKMNGKKLLMFGMTVFFLIKELI